MSTKNIMNLDEAKKIWGDAMSDEDLEKWLELRNKIRPELHDPKIPKGATIEIDSETGKVPPSD
jgi:DNA helicase TIP49 (TBP-interacting protein)